MTSSAHPQDLRTAARSSGSAPKRLTTRRGVGNVGRPVTTTSLWHKTSATDLRGAVTRAVAVASLADGVASEGGQSWLDGVDVRGLIDALAEAAGARGSLVRDVHDGAQQQFVAAIINAKRAQQAWSSDPAKAKQMLDACVTQTSDGLRMLRELLAGTQPSSLSNLGLRLAVEKLAEGLPLPVRVDVSTDHLPAALEASLYFFLSEALTNVVKHANASAAAVTVSVTADQVTAEVSDDGIGGVRLARSGSGLTGLFDRVMALDGELAVESRSGQGTRLRARIPLPSRFQDRRRRFEDRSRAPRRSHLRQAS